jgi:hypothetical protein
VARRQWVSARSGLTNHAAHFAAALWLLTRHPELDLPRELPGIIRAYNEATGVLLLALSGTLLSLLFGAPVANRV